MKRLLLGLPILAFFVALATAQAPLATAPHVESAKYSAFQGQEFGLRISATPTSFTINFKEVFQQKPDIGLSIYNIQISYNPFFSVRPAGDSQTTQFTFNVSGIEQFVFNELFIMYIASDFYEMMGIYMPEKQNTTLQLGLPNGEPNRFYDIPFNFKNVESGPIFPSSTALSNIRLSVYLTGIEGESQTIQNGYSKNFAHFYLTPRIGDSRLYYIRVSISSINGDVLIKSIEFTVVYFDVTKVTSRYQMNSDSVSAVNFGGTFFRTSTEAELNPLEYKADFETNLNYFFGISSIECQQGISINILAVERFNYNDNGRLQNLMLTFETQRNTFIKTGIYYYIQYKALCDEKKCQTACNNETGKTTGTYVLSSSAQKCASCIYFCSTCQNGTQCTGCPAETRKITANNLCECKNNTMYDDFVSFQCQSCFNYSECKTCQRKGVCDSCYPNFTINVVKRTCDCSPALYKAPANSTSNAPSIQVKIENTCLPCPENCIYCTSQSTCQSCTVPTYLATSTAVIDSKFETCTPICNASQIFKAPLRQCQSYSGDQTLFNQDGRLGFDWSYQTLDNQMIIDLVFSQRNMSYYFYENSNAYYYTESSQTNSSKNDGESIVYYDDGKGYINGYASDAFNQFSISSLVENQNFGSALFDNSALQGQYYGLGQATFYRVQYLNYSKTYGPSQTASYYDQYGIPYGKHQLKNQTATESLNGLTFIDALRRNMVLTIDNEPVPYTIQAISGNEFQIIVQPEKSYLTSDVAIIFKNQALIRSGETALQTSSVVRQIDRLDFYSQSQIQSAYGIRDTTSTIVQILWGICKYLLFIGFGWPVMPLMLVMQYIMGHNYISTQLPINLDLFLTAFSDFRNPSILFNPLRNEFDRRVVNHKELYMRVDAYNEFDRNIDFMKNSFEFFFVPLLSFGLFFVFLGVNCLANYCNRDIPLISGYLKPRGGLHAGAYTLVQALPISFFFFGQLRDTRFSSLNQPNSTYPAFNVGMAYASFFASAIIPLMILTFVYNHFKTQSRVATFNVNKFKNEDKLAVSYDKQDFRDPIWGGNPNRSASYGFGGYIFLLPLYTGFFLSLFLRTYPWQITGLLLGNIGLLAFAAASKHFDNKVHKYYFAGSSAILVAYQLVQAGIGSNRALSTSDQWNTGYVGIGLIYALLLVAILFSGYLLYRTFSGIYENHIKPNGCFPRMQDGKLMGQTDEQRMAMRNETTGRNADRRATMMRSKIMENPVSEERFLPRENGLDLNKVGGSLQREPFRYMNTDPLGKAEYIGEISNACYRFPVWSSNLLKREGELFIDGQENRHIWTNNNKDVGSLPFLMRENDESDEDEMMLQAAKKRKEEVKTIIIDNQEMQYEEDENGFYIIRNAEGKTYKRISQTKFLEYHSSNNNKVFYNGKEYDVEADEEEDFFQLVNAQNNNDRIRLSKAEYLALLGGRSQRGGSSQYIVNQQRTTSIIPSRKTIVSSENQQANFTKARQRSDSRQQANFTRAQQRLDSQQQANFTRAQQRLDSRQQANFTRAQQRLDSRQQANFTRAQQRSENRMVINSSKNIYIFNGQECEKIEEEGNFVIFRNLATGAIFTKTKEELERIKVGEVSRSITEEKRIYKIEGEYYFYEGRKDNGRHELINIRNNHIALQLTQDQFLRATGQRAEEKVERRRVLKFVNKNEEGNFIFEDQYTSEHYELPEEMVNIEHIVYIDERGRLWHQNQQLQFESESQISENRNLIEKNIIYEQKKPVPSYQSLSSSKTFFDLQGRLINNHFYKLVFFAENHIFKDEQYSYEDSDVLKMEDSVRGDLVQAMVHRIKDQIVGAKVIIEDITDPEEGLLILEGNY